MAKSTKAAVEIQFNWIFILIAGAVILIFFAMLVTRQKESAETRVNIVVVRALESILTGTKVSEDAATSVTLPVGNIKFDCDSYSIGNVPRKLKQMTVFTPDFIKGKQIITWSYPWDVPFRVTNFLYLTSPQVRYIFVDDGNIDAYGKAIHDALPEGIENKDRNPSSIEDKNNYKIKFIYFDKNQDNNHLRKGANKLFTSTKNEDITAIKIIPGASNDWSMGEVWFYNSLGTSWGPGQKSYYYQNATLFAAIFSEDINMYQCVMEKEFKKLNRVAEVLKKRSTKLMSNYAPGSECYKHHSFVVYGSDAPPTPIPSPGLETGPLGGQRMSGAGFSHISNLNAWIISLTDRNKNAEEQSCALIY